MLKRKIVIVVLLVLALSVVVLASEQWKASVSKDEMTGEETWYAISPRVGPTKRMSFPYSDVEAWLGIGYDGVDEWVFVGFTASPNLNDTETKDGYYLINTRIKWDDKIKNIRLIQEWGSKFIHFRDKKSVISNLKKSDTVLLELNWYGQGKVYFRFPLDGSVDAINEIHNAFGN